MALNTLHAWFSDDLIKDEIQRQLEHINDIFCERKATLSMAGLVELEAMVRMPVRGTTLEPFQKLDVIKEILDRHEATMKPRQNQPSVNNIGNLQMMTDEQIVASIAHVLGNEAPQLPPAIEGNASDNGSSAGSKSGS